MSQADLVAVIRRHGFKANNAQVAAQRAKKYTDDDGNSNLRLLSTGLKKAEEFMARNAV
jgi:hypothetical protein